MPRISYTNEEIAEAAKQCTTLKEFCSRFRKHWQQARNRKILKTIAPHLQKAQNPSAPLLSKYGKWNLDLNDIKTINEHRCVKARCDCGRTEKYIPSYQLRTGKTTECFLCAHTTNIDDFFSKTYGQWTVIGTVIEKGPCGRPVVLCRCTCGRTSLVEPQALTKEYSTKCQWCSPNISKPNREIHAYIQSLGFTDASLSDRSLGREIDVAVPSKKLLIEYDGVHWHSEARGMTYQKEKARREFFRKTGWTVFRIFEDEWIENRELVLSMLKNRLGIRPTYAPAQIEYRQIETPTATKDFFKRNHLQGYGKCKTAFGAFDNGTLIACMSFRHMTQGKFKGQIELSRFCSEMSVDTHGCFGKLLKMAVKYFKSQGYTHIASYSENRLSSGKVYANNGFTKQKTADNLDYFYVLKSRALRFHRQMFQKLNPPKITPEEFNLYPTERAQAASGTLARVKLGIEKPLYRIWGWGNTLWVRKIT